MAITLTIEKKGQPRELARSVPVGTQAIFDQYWGPPANALALQWVPLFRTGVPLEAGDVPDVIGELKTLRESIERSGGDAAEIVLPRIDRLINELEAVASDREAELYIG